MLPSLATSLHLLAAIIWVGGMFFAHVILRPSANRLFDPPQRLPLMNAVFQRFFPWVWISILLLLASGLWLLFEVFGGMAQARLYIHLMFGLGLVMMGLFFILFFWPYRAMRQAVALGQFAEGGRQLARIRLIITINLILGLITSVIGAGGRYL